MVCRCFPRRLLPLLVLLAWAWPLAAADRERPPGPAPVQGVAGGRELRTFLAELHPVLAQAFADLQAQAAAPGLAPALRHRLEDTLDSLDYLGRHLRTLLGQTTVSPAQVEPIWRMTLAAHREALRALALARHEAGISPLN